MDSSFTFTAAKTDLVAVAAAGSQYRSRRQPCDHLNRHIAFLMTSADAEGCKQGYLTDRLKLIQRSLSTVQTW